MQQADPNGAKLSDQFVSASLVSLLECRDDDRP